MSRPENTSNRDPMLHLLGSMTEGSDSYITGMEAAGQRQLLNSDRLPTQGSDDPGLLELGFTFGQPDPADPLFRPATLPDGWSREGSDHAMHSYLLDQRGLRRVGVFYKAAFYDRKASMHLMSVGRDLATEAIYGEGEVTGPWEKLTADELADAEADARDYIKDADEHPDMYGKRVERARELLRQLIA